MPIATRSGLILQAATGIPFVKNVDLQLSTPVIQGQTIGIALATQFVESWLIIADSSIQLGGSPFFSIDNSGTIKITAAGASSGSTIGYQGAPYVLTLQAYNSFGKSPDNTGYVTIGIPRNGNNLNVAFPGPSTVGYYNEPNFNTTSNPNGAGNLSTNATNNVSTTGTTYSYVNFTTSLQVSGNNNVFIGCKFNGVGAPGSGSHTVSCTTGTGNSFSYCSFIPGASSPHPIPMMQWPSAGTQTGVNANSTPTAWAPYMIPPDNVNQFGIGDNAGSNTFTNCDIWGAANAADQNGSSTSYSNCWVHDARNPTTYTDHVDGIGYLNSGAAPNSVSITNCTIASIGNTNSIAWQGASSGYTNMTVSGTYIAGYAASFFHGSPTPTCNTAIILNNIFGSDIALTGNPITTDVTFTTGGTGSWRGNKFHVCPNAPTDPANVIFTFTSADDGKFIYPNNTLNASDYTG